MDYKDIPEESFKWHLQREIILSYIDLYPQLKSNSKIFACYSININKLHTNINGLKAKYEE
jgi:hypothetical protein